MPTPVLMPQMGESIAEGTIVRWIKKVGDTVDRDEPLFEISTDKVDAEIPAPAAGVLTEIKVKEGETVAVNSVVATIGTSSDVSSGQEPEAPYRGLQRLVPHRPPIAAAVHGLQALGGDGRAAVDHHQPPHPLGMPGREGHRVVAAHGVADHGHAAPAQGVHHPDQVAREVLGGVRRTGRPLAPAVAALVERDHVIASAERGDDGVEPVRVRGATVQEAERGATGLAPFQRVEGQPADLEGALTGGFTGESRGSGHARHCTQTTRGCDESRCQVADFVSPPTAMDAGLGAGHRVFSDLPACKLWQAGCSSLWRLMEFLGPSHLTTR